MLSFSVPSVRALEKSVIFENNEIVFSWVLVFISLEYLWYKFVS